MVGPLVGTTTRDKDKVNNDEDKQLVSQSVGVGQLLTINRIQQSTYGDCVGDRMMRG